MLTPEEMKEYLREKAEFRHLQEIAATCECSCGGRLEVAWRGGQSVLRCGKGCAPVKPVNIVIHPPWWVTPKERRK